MIYYTTTPEQRVSPFDGTTETVLAVRDVLDGQGWLWPSEVFEFAEGTDATTILANVTAALAEKGIPV